MSGNTLIVVRQTIRELVYYDDNPATDPYAPESNTDSYSFAPEILGITSPYAKRDYSYASQFYPNTSFPGSNTKWTQEGLNRVSFEDYYILHDSGPPEHWYKLIRRVTYGGGGGHSLVYEFFDLNFSGSVNPEWCLLPQGTGGYNSPEFNATKSALELLTDIDENDFN